MNWKRVKHWVFLVLFILFVWGVYRVKGWTGLRNGLIGLVCGFALSFLIERFRDRMKAKRARLREEEERLKRERSAHEQ